ncbi:ATP-binding cassette domain-containing protein [Agromyces soli]
MFRFRVAPLRQAAFLAAGFIVVRLVYRIVFHGVDGSGLVLLDLPVVRLPAPFAHVTLFGPVTTGGIWTAITSALPFAAVILAFGLVNACIDVSKLFARGARRGPLRGTARVLVIAWATVPALAEATRQVVLARRLRGERGGASLLVPLLERTIERAVAIAAAMEVRGFATARAGVVGTGADGAGQVAGRQGAGGHAVEMRGVVLSHGGERDASAAPHAATAPDASPPRRPAAGAGAPGPASTPARWRLEVDELVLDGGTLAVVGGPTGSGKSTLLAALSGLHLHFDGGAVRGTVRVGGADRASVPPRETAGFVGVVLQNPRLGFTAESVADEIGFALEARGVARVIVASRVAEIARSLGIEPLLGREIGALSAGEAMLVAIAAAVVDRPALLLVDEPLADLDVGARARVVDLLDALAHDAGVCVVVAEHRAEEFAAVADAQFEIDGCLVVPAAPLRSTVLASSGREWPGNTPTSGRFRPFDDGDPEGHGDVSSQGDVSRASAPGRGNLPVLRARGVEVRHGTTPVVVDAGLDLAPGEIVALAGPNGAGKSSLLVALALPREQGRVLVEGVDVASLSRRRRRGAIALVPEASDDLLCATTVSGECRRADRAVGASPGATATRFLELVGAAPAAAERLLAQHPRDLSTGERRCLALAIQLAADAAVLLVDEPTRGLDQRACELVAEALRLVASRGTAVVFATHDRPFADALADRTIEMHGGRVTAAHVATAAPSPVEGGSTGEAGA